MGMVAGIDIGNASTEVALAERQGDKLIFLATAIIPTTGINHPGQPERRLQA